MAKHMVKCKICGCSFDTNTEQAVIAGPRRYAHQACMPEGELVPMEKSSADDPDLIALKEYISNNNISGNIDNILKTKAFKQKAPPDKTAVKPMIRNNIWRSTSRCSPNGIKSEVSVCFLLFFSIFFS